THVNGRIFPAERAQLRNKAACSEARCDIDGERKACWTFCNTVDSPSNLLQSRFQLRLQELASGGELDAAPGAPQQRLTKTRFQCLHLATDGAVGHMKIPCCRGNAATSRDRLEDLQRVE